MNIFEHHEKKFITINGKEFYLLQGFREYQKRYRYGGLVFLQIAGKSPLHYEDLPEKNWEIFKTKTPQGVIYTAFDESYFDYDTPPLERSEAKKSMMFVGRNQAGSLFLALYVCTRLFRMTVSNDSLKGAADRILNSGEKPHPFLTAEDCGNEGNTAYYLKGIGNLYQEMDEETFKSMIEKPKTNGRRKKT